MSRGNSSGSLNRIRIGTQVLSSVPCLSVQTWDEMIIESCTDLYDMWRTLGREAITKLDSNNLLNETKAWPERINDRTNYPMSSSM